MLLRILFSLTALCAITRIPQLAAAPMRVGWSVAPASRIMAGILAANADGTSWYVGYTTSAGLTVSSNALQPRFGGGVCRPPNNPPGYTIPCPDAFIQKYGRDGVLLYSTYFGTSGPEVVTAATADSTGNLIVAVNQSLSGFVNESLLVKLSPSGQLTGRISVPIQITSLATDEHSMIYAIGIGVVGASMGGAGRVACIRVGADLGSVGWSGHFGSSAGDDPRTVAVAPGGTVYIGGVAMGSDFPLTSGSFQSAWKGKPQGPHGFLVKIDPDKSRIVYSTLLQSDGSDAVNGITLHPDGSLFAVGETAGSNFPLTSGAFQAERLGEKDAFIVRLSPDGTEVVASTLLGGSASDIGKSIALSETGGICATGETQSKDFPLVGAYHDKGTVFITCAAADLAFPSWSTLFGGVGRFGGRFVAVRQAEIIVAGWTVTPFPTTEPSTFEVTSFITKFLPSNKRPQVLHNAIRNALDGSDAFNSTASDNVSPGEVIQIHGAYVGPDLEQVAQLNADGRVPTELCGVTVSFDEIAAPILAASAFEIRAIVPFPLSGRRSVRLRVRYGTAEADPMQITVLTARPILASVAGSSMATVVRPDGSIMSRDNPARHGEVVSLFGTGFGIMNPMPVDGNVTAQPEYRLPFAVSLRFCEQPVNLLYVGPAPGMVAGAVQLNAMVPPSVRGECSISLEYEKALVAGKWFIPIQ